MTTRSMAAEAERKPRGRGQDSQRGAAPPHIKVQVQNTPAERMRDLYPKHKATVRVQNDPVDTMVDIFRKKKKDK